MDWQKCSGIKRSYLVALMMITYIPQISLFIPQLLGCVP
ncbi:putative membrane protein [Shigella dysenteriae 155-74]|nr:putative membrane protein [Shigella dysenteriae 155-74]